MPGTTGKECAPSFRTYGDCPRSARVVSGDDFGREALGARY